MNKTLFEISRAFPTISPAAYNADPTPVAVDRLDAQGNIFRAAKAVIHVGAWTDGTHTFELQHADDDGSGSPDSFAAVPDAELEGTEPVVDDGSNDDSVIELGYKGTKRHLQVAVTVAGATSGAVYGVTIELADPRQMPVSRS